jgi:phage-related protein
VLHAFQKKTRKTSVKDVKTEAQRLRDLVKERA